MRNKIVRLLFSLAVLVFAAAFEEMLPKVLGVGFPLLLCAVQFHAVRRSLPAMVAFASAAGAAEDAISSLPLFTSVSYFLAVALVARRMDIPRAAILLSYPIYQIWLSIWVNCLCGSVFTRVLVSIPLGIVVMFAGWAALSWMERKAAACE